MPCDYRILQSPTKEQVKLILLETVRRSHNREGLYQKIIGTAPLLVALCPMDKKLHLGADILF